MAVVKAAVEAAAVRTNTVLKSLTGVSWTSGQGRVRCPDPAYDALSAGKKNMYMCRLKPIVLFFLIIVFVVSGCAAPPTKGPVPPVMEEKKDIQTLAILPFDNNSVTDPERFEPLTRGIAAMLITDLNQNDAGLKLIERNKIQALLKEIALSQTGSVDATTAIRAGKMLGAQSIAFGSFIVLGNIVRIDTRIIDVETSELIMAESITGNSDAFIQLEQDLAKKIARSLKTTLHPAKRSTGSTIDAAVYFSQGIDALDRGNKNEALKLFNKSITIDPGYRPRVDELLRSID